MPKKKVDTIFGIPVFYDLGREKFTAEEKGQKYEADRLSDLRRDMEVTRPLELEEAVIFADGAGEMVLTTIVRISSHGSLAAGKRAGFGVPLSPEAKDIFPMTSENLNVYRRHKQMREKGWELIHKADQMKHDLEPYPQNFWEDKTKELRAGVPSN